MSKKERWDFEPKYWKMEIDAIRKVATGQITTYDQLREALWDIDYNFQQELEANECDMIWDLDDTLVRRVSEAEEEGMDIREFAWDYLSTNRKVREAIESFSNRTVFRNKDGHICDEYGNLLSNDMEHRVWEVIPGGKK